MNLGVVQLALFDIVIASDKSTFETPYVKMGQIPEGYCIWHNMNKIRGSFVCILLVKLFQIIIIVLLSYILQLRYRKLSYFGYVKKYSLRKLPWLA